MESIQPATTESQSHGKTWEILILRIYGLDDDTIKTYSNTSKYDANKNHTKHGRNLSIKATGKNAPDCGDIIRFLPSVDTDIIVINYKQEGEYKIVKNTIIIKHEAIINKIINDLHKKKMSFKGWINDIQNYIYIVKDAPKNTKIKDLPWKNVLELPYFGIRPKTDQDRVQCEVKLNKLLPLLNVNKDYTISDGAILNGVEYISKIKSPPRSRNTGITKDNMINYCKNKNIKGYSKKKKEDLIQYIINTSHNQDDEFIEKLRLYT